MRPLARSGESSNGIQGAQGSGHSWTEVGGCGRGFGKPVSQPPDLGLVWEILVVEPDSSVGRG